MGLRVMMNDERRALSRFMEGEHDSNSRHLEILKKKLKQVALLCRVFNKKAEIIYETEREGMRCITSMVWLATNKKVVLKEGISIPVTSIRGIRVL